MQQGPAALVDQLDTKASKALRRGAPEPGDLPLGDGSGLDLVWHVSAAALRDHVTLASPHLLHRLRQVGAVDPGGVDEPSVHLVQQPDGRTGRPKVLDEC